MLAAIARDAELPSVADEAASLAERLSAGRFFVACVGQFKRGKSNVLNALVGDPVLPTGVTPVTSVVTILRYGAERRGTVFYTAGPNEEIPVEDVPLYVTGEHNHENVKGVAVVEVFLPAPLLARGLCLVDTPGIGSTFAANSEVTRAFVPHIDAALVVLGADPPISGDELALVLDVLRQVPNAIFVLNKADRLSSQDMRQAREFTERLIGEHLGRPVASPLEISALERIQSGATRDWDRLHDALVALNTDAAEQLRDDLDERRGALVRPIQESEARIVHLQRSVADAEQMLHELGILLAAEQRRLLREFQDACASGDRPAMRPLPPNWPGSTRSGNAWIESPLSRDANAAAESRTAPARREHRTRRQAGESLRTRSH